MKKVVLLMTGVTVLCAYSESSEEMQQRFYKYREELEAAEGWTKNMAVDAWCKMLEENFDDSYTVYLAMQDFYFRDGRDAASPGHPEALYWARRVLREKDANRYISTVQSAGAYLAFKGDARDIDLLSDAEQRGFLNARVAGTNLLNHIQFVYEKADWRGCIPSVTNTGPQGRYVNEILRQYWITLEVQTYVLGPMSYSLRDTSKVPDELITLVVWFDEDGNPVCNVDLAKYGLTMPEFDERNRLKPKVATASLPSADEAQRLEAVATVSPNRLWLCAVIFSTLCAGTALAVWLLRKRSKKY